MGLSKKVFKDVLGHMYKTRMVSLGEEFVELLPEEGWRQHWIAGAARPARSPSAQAISRVTQGRTPQLGDPNFALLGGVKPPAPVAKRRGSAAVVTRQGAGAVADEEEAEEEDDEVQDLAAWRREARERIEADDRTSRMEAKQRVEQAKLDKYAAEEALRTRRIKSQVREERAALDETVVNRRGEMLKASASLPKGGGMKATLARIKAGAAAKAVQSQDGFLK